MADNSITTTTDAGLDRRSLMGRIGAGAASAVAVAAVAAGGLAAATVPAQAATVTDADILNFALNLEYLEAEFYIRAYFGYGLGTGDTSGIGAQPHIVGGAQVPFKSTAIQSYCQRLASDELTHVRFLRSALGSAAVAEPPINLVDSFNILANAAGLGGTFNPFADELSFLIGAFIFEDVGVTAYNGAVTLIQNKGYLQAASGILAIEAYHSGSIRTLLAGMGAGQTANAISAVRATAGGGKEQGIIVPGNNFNAVASDSNSLAFARTTNQVLNIVYAGGGAAAGGFFPVGVNGTIQYVPGQA